MVFIKLGFNTKWFRRVYTAAAKAAGKAMIRRILEIYYRRLPAEINSVKLFPPADISR
jgi:hypothetical protein